MDWFASARRWLGHCVIDHSDIDADQDRPFRLRRVSIVLLAAGWVAFLASCLMSLWIVRSHLPLVSIMELARGLSVTRGAVFDSLSGIERSVFVTTLWATQCLQWLGAALFFAGLGSVALFDVHDERSSCRVDSN